MIVKGIRHFMQGRVRVQTVASDERVVSDTGWIPNLILNQGMNGLATRFFADSFTHCCLGDATAPTVLLSGATNASQSNVTVTLSGGSFVFTNTATDSGKVIKYDSGQQATIVTVSSPTSAVVNVSQNVSSTPFKVYQTTQTGLGNEIKRTNTYWTQANGCTTTISAPVVAMRRTFNFTIETPTEATYNEVGLSWTGTPGANLFSRIALPSPVIVPPGIRARVIYELHLTLTPNTPTARSSIITGWPLSPAVNTDATEVMEDWGLAVVNSVGATVTHRTVSGVDILGNEPSATAQVLVGTNTTALLNLGDPVLNRWQAGSFHGNLVNEPYINGTYTRFRTIILTTSDLASTAVRIFCVGHVITPGTDFLPVYTMLFDQAQTKTGAVTLGLRFRLIWSRVFA